MVAETFKREGKGVYQPTLVNTRLELCEFFNGSSTGNAMVQKIWPDVKKELEKYIHPCPYSVNSQLKNLRTISTGIIVTLLLFQGKIFVENFEADGSLVSRFFPTGSYRLDFYVNNADNLGIISMKYYFYINNFF
jgi:Protein of unknown function (DUF1091)